MMNYLLRGTVEGVSDLPVEKEKSPFNSEIQLSLYDSYWVVNEQRLYMWDGNTWRKLRDPHNDALSDRSISV